jgi:hypothetical protein
MVTANFRAEIAPTTITIPYADATETIQTQNTSNTGRYALTSPIPGPDGMQCSDNEYKVFAFIYLNVLLYSRFFKDWILPEPAYGNAVMNGGVCLIPSQQSGGNV